MDVLIHQELNISLENKPMDLSMKDCKKINRQVCGTICLCLAKGQKYFIMREMKALRSCRKKNGGQIHGQECVELDLFDVKALLFPLP